MSSGKEMIAAKGILQGIEASPEAVRAMNALASRQIPKEFLETHPGRGGTFTYISHVHITNLLLDLPVRWDYQVSSPQVWDDNSATVLCTLSVEYEDLNGVPHKKVVTEIGAFEGAQNMAKANKLAAASSRGLARCAMRMFGLGLELYKHEVPKPTPESNWALLKDYASRYKVSQPDLIEFLKAMGIGKAQLVERWEEAYNAVAAWCSRRNQTEVPKELG